VSRIAYLDCVGGVAGDMFLAALLDAGADLERLRTVPGLLGIGDVEIRAERVMREGVAALQVTVGDPPDPPARTWRAMEAVIERSELPDGVLSRSLTAFRRLAEAEARVHGQPIDDVHFHELGGVDTLVDICGTMLLLADLAVERVFASPLPYARGLVRAAHGVLPTPAPATLELLKGARLEGREGEGERVTPTGATLVATLAEAYGPPPPLVLSEIGYGAGSTDTPARPNVLRLLLGEIDRAPGSSDVVLLETNLDDLNPELVPDAVQRCFAAGALDVWSAPVQMKKGRPGIVLSALARPDSEHAVAAAMFEETSALGVRVASHRRYELDRDELLVELDGGTVRVKLGRLDGRVVNVAPEHDDCAELARRTGRSVKSVWAQALARTIRP
jgi:uncharacterized protein (TIGR00299 family) protein